MNAEIKQQVREFYNRVGWQEQSDGFYQNASYEDLRPVAQEYIHKCHLRVLRHLNSSGRFFLDAGSGPIQYPEYLEYSRGYQYRVCADISIVALQEARKRIGEHGLFVVCDVACLPFKPNAFDGEVSLHTLHHLPPEEHVRAYQELHRTLAQNGKAVIVNGWDHAPLSTFFDLLIGLFSRIRAVFNGKTGPAEISTVAPPPAVDTAGSGTYVSKETPSWLRKEVGSLVPIKIRCWRSVNVRTLRALFHPNLAGKFLLKVLYLKEELLPYFFGVYGQYPLVELRKKQ